MNDFILLFDTLSELFLYLRKVIVVVFMFGLEDLNLVLSWLVVLLFLLIFFLRLENILFEVVLLIVEFVFDVWYRVQILSWKISIFFSAWFAIAVLLIVWSLIELFWKDAHLLFWISALSIFIVLRLRLIFLYAVLLADRSNPNSWNLLFARLGCQLELKYSLSFKISVFPFVALVELSLCFFPFSWQRRRLTVRQVHPLHS